MLDIRLVGGVMFILFILQNGKDRPDVVTINGWSAKR